MNILITGYTTRMFGSDRIRGDYVTFSFILEEILKSLGHRVERRKVLIGEDLSSKYDYAFCGVAPLSSMTAGRVPETHYAMDTMRGRHCVYADDWSFCDYGESVRYTLERWDNYLSYKKFPYSHEILEKTKESLENMMDYSEEFNAPVLAPMFPWGSHKILMTGSRGKPNYSAKLVTVDPSRWVTFPTVNIPEPLNRKRQWVMAALSNHSNWVKKQGFKLPVTYIGNKNLGPSLSESDTVRMFADSYGVLSTGYPSSGSGWWRTRYLNAAWAESIVYCDPKDQEIMGRPYQGSVEFFENIQSENEYTELAAEQANWIFSRISAKETTLAIIERLMKK